MASAFVSPGLMLSGSAQCAFPTTPFSFTALYATRVTDVSPTNGVEPIGRPEETGPPLGQITDSDVPFAVPETDALVAVAAVSSTAETPSSPAAEFVAAAPEPDVVPVEPAMDPVRPALSLSESVDSARVIEIPGADSVRFIGLVEAAAGDLRVAVLRVGARVFYGRKGDIVGGRYRLLGFTEDAAQVFDLNASTTRTLAMGLP